MGHNSKFAKLHNMAVSISKSLNAVQIYQKYIVDLVDMTKNIKRSKVSFYFLSGVRKV